MVYSFTSSNHLCRFSYAAMLLCGASLIGCSENEPNPAESGPVVETVSVITSGDSVYFIGNIPFKVSGEITSYGFLVGPDSSSTIGKTSVSIELTTEKIEKGRFRASRLNSFTQHSRYYCRAFLRVGSTTGYGKAKLFDGRSESITLTDFAPSEGYDGELVKIYGSGFDQFLQVFVNNTEGEVLSASADRIVFKVPTYKVAGPATLVVRQNGQSYYFEKQFLLRGPVIESFTPKAGRGLVTFTVTGKNFSDYTWRNKVTLIQQDPQPDIYDASVIAATAESLQVEINSINIPPGSYTIGVTVDNKLALSSAHFEITTPWEFLTPKPGEGLANSATFQIDNKLYFCTGTTNWLTNAGYTSQVWEYDISLDQWTRKSDFPGGPRINAIGFSVSGNGYVGMGYRKEVDAAVADLWQYNPSTDEWIEKASFPGGPRSGAIAVAHEGFAYVGLGGAACCTLRKDFWRYNAISDAWEQLPDFEGHTRGKTPVVIANNKLYIIGGFDSSTIFDSDTWSLDLATNQWSSTGLIEHIRPEAAFTDNNKVYLLHSFFNYFNYNEMHFSEFDPETNTIVRDHYMFPGAYSSDPAICLFHDGSVYLGLGTFGGYGECLNELWKFTL